MFQNPFVPSAGRAQASFGLAIMFQQLIMLNCSFEAAVDFWRSVWQANGAPTQLSVAPPAVDAPPAVIGDASDEEAQVPCQK